MSPSPKRPPKIKKPAAPPARFAPSQFLSATPQQAQRLCTELASEVAQRFADLTGTTWRSVGAAVAQQLRARGHDLMNLEDTEELQEWHATWHHPRGTFSLLLSFRAPKGVEVTWKTEDAEFVGRAGAN